MKLTLVDNRTVRMSAVMSEELRSATSAYMATAFVKRSGLRVIEPALNAFLDAGGYLEVICGLDFRLTEPQAILQLLAMGSKPGYVIVKAFSDPAIDDVPTFHPKLYMFEREQRVPTVIIGSSNLTKGGLEDNEEVNLMVGAGARHPLVLEAKRLYQRYRQQPSLFPPDEEYLERYADAYRRVERSGRRAFRSPEVRRVLDELRAREPLLAQSSVTQKDLVAQAIVALRRSPDEFIHLADISRWVETTARARGLDYKWDTLWNSIRGRLNENTVGKQGDDLFERSGGLAGREGRYRLSEKGGAQYAKAH